ncbi:MAG: leucine-rich repeat domain-containing protein [Lachnospiraceae bacterium]|nr:leucine-rich repeat domain-containing protein [Lachnospiraceae bacterium]
MNHPLSVILPVIGLILLLLCGGNGRENRIGEKPFLFEPSEDGTGYVLIGVDDPTIIRADIPASHRGRPVLAIGEYAFQGCLFLEEVRIPDTVTSIGTAAFVGCVRLRTIIIPDSVLSIGPGAFYRCIDLQEMILGSHVEQIGSNAFYSCESLRLIRFSEGMERLESWAQRVYYDINKDPEMYRASVLIGTHPELVIIPEGVTVIESGFLCACTIDRIILPRSLKRIDEGSYHGHQENVKPIEQILYCGSRSEFEEIEGMFTGSSPVFYYSETEPEVPGAYWHYVDGAPVVWSTGAQKLYFTPTGDGSGWCVSAALPADGLGNLEIPAMHEGLPVKEIAPLGFIGHDDLTSIALPETLEKIGLKAFAGCDSLKELVLPEGVRVLETGSLSFCKNLEYVFIPGTVSDLPGYLINGNPNLTEIRMGDGVKTISLYAVSDCEKLRKITFSDSIESLYDPVRNCLLLEEIHLPETLRTLHWAHHSSHMMPFLRIPDQVTEASLLGFENLKKVIIPELLIIHQHYFSVGEQFYFKGSEETWDRWIENREDAERYSMYYGSKQIWFYAENQPEKPGCYWHEVDGLPVEWHYD